MSLHHKLHLQLLTLCFAVPVVLAPHLSAATERPNIVLIMVDDMGFSDLGCYGGEIETPHIDRLAANGVKFSQFYNSARCCPTRATLMTGLHPHQVGIGHMTNAPNHKKKRLAPAAYQGFLNRDCVTLAEVLRDAGYATLMTGKWHLGYRSKDRWPLQRGFDKYYGCVAGGTNYFSPTAPRRITLNNEPVESPKSTTERRYYTTDAYTDYAIRFIEESETNESKPFFLYLAYTAPHWPLHAHDEEIAKYRGRYRIGWEELRRRRFQRQREIGLIDAGWKLSPQDADVPAWDSLDEAKQDEMDLRMALYAAMIDRVDQNIGKLLRALENRGQLDNSLILFLSDNGACAEGGILGGGQVRDKKKRNARFGAISYGKAWANVSSTPYRLYKHFTHEGGSCTPFIMHWPKRISSNEVWYRDPAQIFDIFPTLLDVAGAKYPKRYHGRKIPPLEGITLTPSFELRSLRRTEPIYIEHENNAFVRDGKWKLVGRNVAQRKGVNDKKWELYDMQKDGTELHNLFESRPDVAQNLVARWKDWAHRIGVYPKALSAANALEVVDQWKYSLQKPTGPWRQLDYNDADWRTGIGGFGTKNTPESRIGTLWTSQRIWLRKYFHLASVPKNPAILVHHDEDAKIYVNGQLIAELNGWLTDYELIPLDRAHAAALRAGKNVLAVHCRQTGGDQFIDAHVVDADNVPDLPRPKATDIKIPNGLLGKTQVPFRLESTLGGVERFLDESIQERDLPDPPIRPTVAGTNTTRELSTSRFADGPNIVLVFIDDLGWGDFSCFGNDEIETENIDRLAAEGLRFQQFYVNSPICSPSRVAITTGLYPQRFEIGSYLARRELNRARGIADWLDPNVPTLADSLRAAGYATGHFGKWHMGGQRDVHDAPLITEYGFDQSLTNFEGLGDRVIALIDRGDGRPPAKHAMGSDRLGRGEIIWRKRHEVTTAYCEAALDFIQKAESEGRPFYVNVWPDDVHTPLVPPVARRGDGSKRSRYLGVLDTMDEQLGSLFDYVRGSDLLRENTLILVCSDNGPERGAGSTGGLRGWKTHLYEGGIRSPLIVWGPGFVEADVAGTSNEETVMAAIDLVPSLLAVARIAPAVKASLDGLDMHRQLLGRSSTSRQSPIMFRRPPDRDSFYGVEDLPDLAIRSGDWKLLCEYDGSDAELYNLRADPIEDVNVAGNSPEIAADLTRRVVAWHESMPKDLGDSYKRN